MTYQVAVAPGDGIGPELTRATQQVLAAAGARIEWVPAPVGKAALECCGEELPWSSLETMRRLKVVLKGPLIAERMSGGAVVNSPEGRRRHPSVNNALRRELGLYANLRPVRGFEGVSGRHAAMDVVIVREVTEDIYSGIEYDGPEESADAIKRVTGRASRRIARFAFEYARRHGRGRVTAIHKANVLHKTDGLFLRCVREVAAEYGEIGCDDAMVDAAAYLLIKNPKAFDVMVLPNQYGDILSDVAGGLAGSLGLAPGANLGDEIAVFEAAHGAAPDIAGRNRANPISLILSGAMLMDQLGECEIGERIRFAVEQVLREGRCLTADLGGSASTEEITEAICAACWEVAA